jgi:hypothetical protein
MSSPAKRRRNRVARRRRLRQLQGTPRGARKEAALDCHRAKHPRKTKWERWQRVHQAIAAKEERRVQQSYGWGMQDILDRAT